MASNPLLLRGWHEIRKCKHANYCSGLCKTSIIMFWSVWKATGPVLNSGFIPEDLNASYTTSRKGGRLFQSFTTSCNPCGTSNLKSPGLLGNVCTTNPPTTKPHLDRTPEILFEYARASASEESTVKVMSLDNPIPDETRGIKKFVIAASCAGLIVLHCTAASSDTTFDLNTRLPATNCALVEPINTTSFSSCSAWGISWNRPMKSIVTPIATAVINCNSLRLWCDLSSSSLSSGSSFINKAHSPTQPIATNPAPPKTQQIQNQNEGTEKYPMTAIKTAAMVMQIIFGLVLVFLVGAFWHITFSQHNSKK